MPPKFATGNDEHLEYVLTWLKEEDQETGEGFFCNATIIKKCFLERRSVCAIVDNVAVAFAVFYVAAPASGLEIVEVHPRHRKQGLGRDLTKEILKRLRRRGAEYVDADCTSAEGEALCLAAGFRPRDDIYAYRSSNILAQLRYQLASPALTQ